MVLPAIPNNPHHSYASFEQKGHSAADFQAAASWLVEFRDFMVEKVRLEGAILVGGCMTLTEALDEVRPSLGIWPVGNDTDSVVVSVLGRVTDPVVREALQPLIGELRKQHASVYEMLNRMDRNTGGILSRDELCDGLSEICLTLTPACAARLCDAGFRVKDDNGNVSYHEFYAVLTKHRAVDHIEASMCSAANAPRTRKHASCPPIAVRGTCAAHVQACVVPADRCSSMIDRSIDRCRRGPVAGVSEWVSGHDSTL
jgi:hypothetical protein